jgi:hypothetical protein
MVISMLTSSKAVHSQGYFCTFCDRETDMYIYVNPLTPNGHYSRRTTPLTSRRCILNIYSTNIHTEYFKHAA